MKKTPARLSEGGAPALGENFHVDCTEILRRMPEQIPPS
jgi:hypothetical protein